MDDAFTGYDSFATEFLASEEFSNPDVQSRLPEKADIDRNNDGKIEAYTEIVNGEEVVVEEKDIDMTVKENILEYFRTPEGYEMARVEIAAWMTAKQLEKHGSGASALQAERDAQSKSR